MIPATREGLYHLLCDLNAIFSEAKTALENNDQVALRTELNAGCDYVREEIDAMETETPDIVDSDDPRTNP